MPASFTLGNFRNRGIIGRVRCLSYELSRWTARGRRAREETSLPGSGSTYRALRGKRIAVSVPLGEGPIFKNPGSRAWSRRACRAREKPHPYAPFVGRLRRLRGSFRWVRVTYGVASGRRDRGKRNDVKIHTCVVGCAAETVTQDAPRSHDEEFLGCGVIFATDCLFIPNYSAVGASRGFFSIIGGVEDY
ncbi:hypothetical protein TNCT_504541 [Trichonephila clavata]|uniref:Uncharacterized protein n=1 Tax=Trichonephila clavata TaxID=2740835 RepID=A0A8X6JBS8_TRICU|nr:hypothetical protein TNCT_504541 [Trichonephila clavata]